jgi:hypothetical protein
MISNERTSSYSTYNGNCIRVGTIRSPWRKSRSSFSNGNCVETATIEMASNWRKSQRSNSQGACVEAGNFRKASYSMQDLQGNCVEVGDTETFVVVRDTKLGEESPVLMFDNTSWGKFLQSIK